ncbi:glucosamine-6-phosphate deaminase [Jeotgalicoccus coquinae]|uniref:Glucosamine-6-phosphate deaminase n=1 Tax=Jeotgalicoccus coquinae TaxID=709509 RepID=A0A6V7RSX2_9STAP|nr:glucosamine-6-phosphate deaminase [Jeotgalicoccus coquinae]MBB6424183.1 glucosamine-6-phosphate deaminase [Jeotgalicoccus coquinae]GGE25865.1 glucosamine-6-phosphate deaminase [Jeotgalicoccus coquinae]CAD2081482.1 Glucosamine-6-phosphate deaminase 1 [Jeotgalicoccus coquinae]
MELVKVSNYEEMSKKASDILFDVIKENEKPVIGLATGSTPEGTYQELIKKLNSSDIDQNNITTFNLDEYVGLDKNHEQSYSYYMYEKFFNHVSIPQENIHLLNGKAEFADTEVKAYEEAIDEAGIDVQLLGIGRNGHIAFNEPGTSFDSVTHIVDLTPETIEDNSRFFDELGEVPSKAFTMGLKSIMKADKIVILIYGENKKEALEALLSGEVTVDNPASVLNNHKDVTIIADNAAIGE